MRQFRSVMLLAPCVLATTLLAQTPPGNQAAPDQGAGRGGRAGGGQGRGGGGRRGGFTQFTRPLASQDVLARGKGLYDTNCASCHAPDLRGIGTNPRLLRSQVALNDQHGELVGKAVAEHNPKINLPDQDAAAIAEYLHSVLATTGGQGSPPGRNPVGVKLEVLVGDAKAGERTFDKICARCHTPTGDMKGIATKYSDPRSLQNAWVSGASAANPFGGGGRGGGNAGNPVTVTLADGSKLEGKLVRADDWLVILTLPDGTRRSMARTDKIKVDIKDPNEAHKKMIMEVDDPENKNLHDITAFLATLK